MNEQASQAGTTWGSIAVFIPGSVSRSFIVHRPSLIYPGLIGWTSVRRLGSLGRLRRRGGLGGRLGGGLAEVVEQLLLGLVQHVLRIRRASRPSRWRSASPGPRSSRTASPGCRRCWSAARWSGRSARNNGGTRREGSCFFLAMGAVVFAVAGSCAASGNRPIRSDGHQAQGDGAGSLLDRHRSLPFREKTEHS